MHSIILHIGITSFRPLDGESFSKPHHVRTLEVVPCFRPLDGESFSKLAGSALAWTSGMRFRPLDGESFSKLEHIIQGTIESV